MPASPVFLQSFRIAPRRSLRKAWLPVLFSIVFVCFTSTGFMGGSHTQVIVNFVWKGLFGKWHYDLCGPANWITRKVYHFLGYGVIGLIFSNAFHGSVRAVSAVLRSWLTPFSASFGIAATFAVASLDEWHQRYVPGRVGSLRDVFIDTSGALCLSLIVWAFRARRRRAALRGIQPSGIQPSGFNLR